MANATHALRWFEDDDDSKRARSAVARKLWTFFVSSNILRYYSSEYKIYLMIEINSSFAVRDEKLHLKSVLFAVWTWYTSHYQLFYIFQLIYLGFCVLLFSLRKCLLIHENFVVLLLTHSSSYTYDRWWWFCGGGGGVDCKQQIKSANKYSSLKVFAFLIKIKWK